MEEGRHADNMIEEKEVPEVREYIQTESQVRLTSHRAPGNGPARGEL